MAKVEVFYSTRCPHCRAARSIVKRVVKRFRKRLEKQFGRRFEERLGWSLEVEEVNTSMRSSYPYVPRACPIKAIVRK